MNVWTALLDVLIILLAAMVLGGLFERFKQNAILGYLLAGALLGPHALDLIPNHEVVRALTELGVALLLFVIGLEFSWRRLRSLGAIALVGGTLQILVTLVLATFVAMMAGLSAAPAFVVGGIIALSSTAVVMRLLTERAEIDSIYGRNTLGILLLQDIAVVPLVLVVSILGGDAANSPVHWAVARAIGAAIVLGGALYLLLHHIVPRLLWSREATRNRDLPVLLTMVTAVGSAWAAHALGLSPVLGAFVAGVILAESPFATQIRSDITPLKTLFVTLFFSLIGVLINPVWMLEHWVAVAAIVLAVVCGKIIVVSAVARLLRASPGHAVATGFCLAQVGEFSFMIADVARSGGVIDQGLFELMTTVTVVTLMLTPYLVATAPGAVRRVDGLSDAGTGRGVKRSGRGGEIPIHDHIVIAGYGPAGKQVAEKLLEEGHALVVIDLNPRTAVDAPAPGIPLVVGDATRWELLQRVGVASAKAVAVTVPDPATAMQITASVRAAGFGQLLVTRSRYHRYAQDLKRAGADAVVDEETEVGSRIALAIEGGLGERGPE
jgi:CPA2 family monovalent cation:H+ antiporter-2